MSNSCISNLRRHKTQLKQLVSAEPVKYSNWKPKQINNTHKLSLKAGVYHFFEELENGDIESLYVGKGGFSENGRSLFERLKQHFQPKGDGLLKKYSKYGYLSSSAMKNDLVARNVYVQWLPLYHRLPDSTLDLHTCNTQNREIILCEHFCISILDPKFND